MDVEVDAPWLSVTVSEIVWSPSVAGAVHVVVAAVGAEKPSVAGLTDQAKAMVSPAFGSWAVALAVTDAPGTTLVDERTNESITGTAFLKGTEAAVDWAVMTTDVVWSFMMAIAEAVRRNRGCRTDRWRSR